jgi:hypothetical protein
MILPLVSDGSQIDHELGGPEAVVGKRAAIGLYQ